MSDFARPTLAEIVDRVESDYISRLPLTGAVLRRSMVRILARVIAGTAHMLYGYIAWVARQIFPDQSEDAQLVRQASMYGVVKTPPTFARSGAAITGVNLSVVPADSLLARSDGAVYKVVTASAPIAAGVGSIVVQAVVAGASYTLTAGTILSFQSPISGVNSTVVVGTPEIDGSDRETTEALRARLLERLAEPAHGGNIPDYVAWSKEVAGVTRAWVYPLSLGPGTVLVRFVRDNDLSTIIPDAGEVAALQTYLNAKAPAHATVTAFAPALAPVNFTIAVVPNTLTVKAAVTAELVDLFLRSGTPGGTVLLSAQRTAIGTAAGLTDYVLTIPAANVTHTASQLPTLGVITWA